MPNGINVQILKITIVKYFQQLKHFVSNRENVLLNKTMQLKYDKKYKSLQGRRQHLLKCVYPAKKLAFFFAFVSDSYYIIVFRY